MGFGSGAGRGSGAVFPIGFGGGGFAMGFGGGGFAMGFGEWAQEEGGVQQAQEVRAKVVVEGRVWVVQEVAVQQAQEGRAKVEGRVRAVQAVQEVAVQAASEVHAQAVYSQSVLHELCLQSGSKRYLSIHQRSHSKTNAPLASLEGWKQHFKYKHIFRIPDGRVWNTQLGSFQKGTRSDGYTALRIEGKVVKRHRLNFEIATGRAIKPGGFSGGPPRGRGATYFAGALSTSPSSRTNQAKYGKMPFLRGS
ncbi:hypothetical protein KFL_008360090 [Klebsormidium nitens]|uniref:Uncharacterized protein n=1 Tax=Klebsormidium nitens TaxID=105231 RepID=A0A1Y1IR30_KLENI|nr:hypothetical protein KFL_008360090 [Klebsormidium nitens]|eukprot:GAQ91701.1 hypothetical protein KFL_008360090 [Klebsormidium nitens]